MQHDEQVGQKWHITICSPGINLFDPYKLETQRKYVFSNLIEVG